MPQPRAGGHLTPHTGTLTSQHTPSGCPSPPLLPFPSLDQILLLVLLLPPNPKWVFFLLTQLNCPTYSFLRLSSFSSSASSSHRLESLITLPNLTNQQRRAPTFLLQGATCCSSEMHHLHCSLTVFYNIFLPENTQADTLRDSTMVRSKQLLHTMQTNNRQGPGLKG